MITHNYVIITVFKTMLKVQSTILVLVTLMINRLKKQDFCRHHKKKKKKIGCITQLTLQISTDFWIAIEKEIQNNKKKQTNKKQNKQKKQCLTVLFNFLFLMQRARFHSHYYCRTYVFICH